MNRIVWFVLLAVAIVSAASCAWTTRHMSPSSGSGPVGATVTIGSDGSVSPKSVTIAPGQVVAFVNKDSHEHLMFSNPHPVHTDCRAVNAVGKLLPGQTRNTGNFESVRACGFHDHGDAGNAALHGSITVAN